MNVEPASLANRSDEELVRAGSAGEAHCFEELVRRYMKPIFNFAYRMIGNYAEADDVAQDVFVQVYRSLPTIRADLPFKPWLYTVARNRCLDVLKRKRPLTFSAIEDSERGEGVLDRIADPDPLPDEMFERADLQRVLHEAIEKLPEKYRTVVILRYASGLTFAEIGEALALSENTVKTHFQRAKAALRANLKTLA